MNFSDKLYNKIEIFPKISIYLTELNYKICIYFFKLNGLACGVETIDG